MSRVGLIAIIVVVVAVVIAIAWVSQIYYTSMAPTPPAPPPSPSPTPTPTPTPTPPLIDFETAVEIARGPREPIESWRWKSVAHYSRNYIGFQGEPLEGEGVTGRLLYYMGDGYLYEAEYPSGRVYDQPSVVFIDMRPRDNETFHVWEITIPKRYFCYIHAGTGEVLSFLRYPVGPKPPPKEIIDEPLPVTVELEGFTFTLIEVSYYGEEVPMSCPDPRLSGVDCPSLSPGSRWVTVRWGAEVTGAEPLEVDWREEYNLEARFDTGLFKRYRDGYAILYPGERPPEYMSSWTWQAPGDASVIEVVVLRWGTPIYVIKIRGG